MSPFVRLCSALLALFATAALFAATPGTAEPEFRLREFLGRNWQNEAVRFPLSAAGVEHVKARHALVAQDGRVVPYQVLVHRVNGTPAIEFLTDLRPFAAAV